MKTRTLLLSVVLIFALPLFSHGQVGGLLRNKAARVINAGAKALSKDVDNKTDSAAQKEAEKQVQNADQEIRQQDGDNKDDTVQNENRRRGSLNLGGLMGGKVTAKYNESYSFNKRIYMQMEMHDKKDVTMADYYIYFSGSGQDAGFEMKMITSSENGEQVEITTSSVFDAENRSFLILTDMGMMKMGIISEVPDESTVQDRDNSKEQTATITATGNTRMIAGYKCSEYLYTDPESEAHGSLWITKDLKLQADKRTFSKAGLPFYYNDPQLEDGIILAMDAYNEKNVLTMKTETKEINLNYDHTISVSGFSLRQVNFNQAGTQNKN